MTFTFRPQTTVFMIFSDRFRPFSYLLLSIIIFLSLGMPEPIFAQQGKYKAYFDEAYEKYPSVPQGMLEAVAYTNTRLTHLDGKQSCQDLPTYYGVMGLVEDGKDYFQSSLVRVAELSGYDIEEIKEDPRTNILAYAAAYAKLQQSFRLVNQQVETHQAIIRNLSEIPQDAQLKNRYANDQQFYGILKEIQQPHTKTGHRLQRQFDLKKVFGSTNYKVLSSPKVKVSEQKISTENGEDFRVTEGSTCTAASPRPDYEGAVWKKAHSNNYGSRGGKSVKYITIHTVQGSYASAISWFRNRNARVSAHYVIRASDGQITQMVCENDKGFHVKTDNAEAIGIEHEGFIDDGIAWYTQAMYEASAELVRDICKRHGIDPKKTFTGPPTTGVDFLSNACYHIKGHQHFRGNNHIDPGPYWDWERYYRLINGLVKPEVFTAKKGEIIDSGKKTGPYASQERVAYLIKPEDAVSITLDFVDFQLEGTEKNPFDYLDIYDGEGPEGRFLGRFTGTKNPGSLISNSGAFFIEFRSDCRIQREGFRIKYKAQTKSRSCGVPQNLIATDVFPLGANLKWEGNASSYILQVKHKNESEWQEYRSDDTQEIVTGLGANGIYEWQVRSVCDGESSAWVGQTFLTPNISRSASPQVFTVRANSGKFLDTGGALAGYSNEENYLYRIIPPNGGKVELSFSKLDTEDQEDFLTVYDGTNISNDPKVGAYSGTNLPPAIRSSRNGLSILFTSDPRVTGSGWVATWRSVKEDPGDPGEPNDPGEPDPDPPGNSTPPAKISIREFSPKLYLHRYAPETAPNLKDRYQGDFVIDFKDRDRSGRGFANRFYTIAEKSTQGFEGNAKAGFLYDEFEGEISDKWKVQSGTWFTQEGKLVQSDAGEGNSNLYAELTQEKDITYIYHWRSMMKGEGDNIRHGLHFFCSEPEKTNRGNSYFIWIRKTDEGDYLEIYKSAFNQFDRKEREEIDLGENQAHDYKVIYNPRRGKMEVYMDNRFAASWQDPYPLSSGKGISLRTGQSITIYDDLKVYQNREDEVRVSTGKAASPITGDGEFLVESLVIDGFIHWSRTVAEQSVLGNPTTEPDPDPGNSTPGNNSGNSHLPTFNRNFDVELTSPEGGEVYALVGAFDGNSWSANTNIGYLYEDFTAASLSSSWKEKSGQWSIDTGTGKLVQRDKAAFNSNLYLSLLQNGEQPYLYHFKAKLNSSGSNQRFGIHIFSDQGNGKNRGDSYLMWFRSQSQGRGKAEFYRSDKNDMPGIVKATNISFETGREYDVKVLYDPIKGQLKAYLDDLLVMDWIDPTTPHREGGFLSLRTGNAQVSFDDFRVYQLQEKNVLTIKIGSDKKDMLPHKSKGNQPAGRLLIIRRDNNGKWKKPEEQNFIIR